MKIATLGIVLRSDEILLGEKKKGEIGTGVLSGPGGKLDPGETLEECLIRETREELDGVELDPASLEKVALIDFYAGTEIDFRVHVYRARILRGEIHETVDMIPRWYSLHALPLDRMYEADRHWLPKAARGEKFRANVYYRERAKGFSSIEFLRFTDDDPA
ncbi:MAG TPA: NUDIX domain-containing protein [Candidatus Paceibacterota bacterium]|nr:NUDIX domain-containing protein [Candidatus Paceibacterota bacterium]